MEGKKSYAPLALTVNKMVERNGVRAYNWDMEKKEKYKTSGSIKRARRRLHAHRFQD